MGMEHCACFRSIGEISTETDLNNYKETEGFFYPRINNILSSAYDEGINITGTKQMSQLMKVNTIDSCTLKNISFNPLPKITIIPIVKLQSIVRGAIFRKKFYKIYRSIIEDNKKDKKNNNAFKNKKCILKSYNNNTPSKSNIKNSISSFYNDKDKNDKYYKKDKENNVNNNISNYHHKEKKTPKKIVSIHDINKEGNSYKKENSFISIDNSNIKEKNKIDNNNILHHQFAPESNTKDKFISTPNFNQKSSQNEKTINKTIKNNIIANNTSTNSNKEKKITANDFIPEQTKISEKFFLLPIDYEEGWKKYLEDSSEDENKEIFDINRLLRNEAQVSYTEGIFVEYKGEKCFYRGYVDKNSSFPNPSGEGEMYFKDGRKYSGFFDEGKFNGLGRYIDSKGWCYEGLFIDGILIGKATVIHTDENKNKIEYFGNTNNFKKEGKGQEKCKLYIYEGDFENNLKQGQGKLIYHSCKDQYEGEFKQGNITGRGKYIWSNKHTYFGQFIDGKMHGIGLYQWPDGSYYDGEYVNGVKEGKGEFKWKDGRIFKGPFKNGKPNGKGILIIKGVSTDVEFKNGKLINEAKDLMRAKTFQTSSIQKSSKSTVK